jgi:hypothetical protein
MIKQCSILDGYNEIFRLNKISSKKPVTIINEKQNKLNELYNISLSFGQLNGFEKGDNFISFMFFGLTTEPLKEDDKISMFVNLIKGNKLIKKKQNVMQEKT